MIDIVMSFFLPALYLLLFTAFLVVILKKSFGKCLPLAMMLSAFLLFFSQLLFGTFEVGFVVGIIVALLSVALVTRKVINGTGEEFRKLYLTSGLVVFLVIYVLVFIYDFSRGFSMWDEFSHWGVMLKEMLRLDKFYYVDASNLMVHKDYPPIMQLFELFWIKLCGGYGEAYAERALHTFELSLVVPFVAEKVAERRNFIKSAAVGLMAAMIAMLMMAIFDRHFVLQTIYTDYAMALVVAYLIAIVFVSKKISWFEIGTLMIGGSFLLLLKQMGLPLYLMIICFMIGVILVREKGKIKVYVGRIKMKRIVLATALLLVPFVIWFIWGKMTNGVAHQFSLSDLSMTEFVKVLMGGGESWQSITVKNYLTALGQENISTSFIQMSFLQGCVLFIGLLWLLWRCFKKDLARKEIVWLGGILITGAIGYTVAMLMLYVLSFGSYEGPILASFDRYMSTFLIIMFGTLVMIFIWQATKTERIGLVCGLAVVLTLCCAPIAFTRIYPYFGGDGWAESKYAVAVRTIKEKIDNDDDAKVFIIDQDDVGAHYYLQYFAEAMKVNSIYDNWDVNVEDIQEYYGAIKEYMFDFDYLYVMNIDDKFTNKYCGVINICPVKNGMLYKIVKDEEKITNYELID